MFHVFLPYDSLMTATRLNFSVVNFFFSTRSGIELWRRVEIARAHETPTRENVCSRQIHAYVPSAVWLDSQSVSSLAQQLRAHINHKTFSSSYGARWEGLFATSLVRQTLIRITKRKPIHILHRASHVRMFRTYHGEHFFDVSSHNHWRILPCMIDGYFASTPCAFKFHPKVHGCMRAKQNLWICHWFCVLWSEGC